MYQISTQNVWFGLFFDFKNLFSLLKNKFFYFNLIIINKFNLVIIMIDFIIKNKFKSILVILLNKKWRYNKKNDEVYV